MKKVEQINDKYYIDGEEVEFIKKDEETAGEKWAQKLGPWDGKSSTACPIRREKGASICNGITCDLPTLAQWAKQFPLPSLDSINVAPDSLDFAIDFAVSNYIKMAKGGQ